jgi:hypothetical protein
MRAGLSHMFTATPRRHLQRGSSSTNGLRSLRFVPRVTPSAETGTSTFVGCLVEQGNERRVSASKAVKPIPGPSPNNLWLPCNVGFYLLDEQSDKKVIHAVTQK